MKTILSISLLIPLSIILFGQDQEINSYIIDLEGNEIEGIFDKDLSTNFPSQVRFKPVNAPYALYGPADIRGFRNGSDNYMSTIQYGEANPRFIKILVDGHKSLFQYKIGGKNFFYINPNEELTLLESERTTNNLGYDLEASIISFKYKGQLLAYLNDCESIKTSTTNYSRISLEKLFRKYYECSSETSSYSTKIEKQNRDINIIFGYTRFDYQFEFFNHQESLGSPEVGIGYYNSIPGTKKLWAFKLEMLVSQFQSERTYDTNVTREYIYTNEVENLIIEKETTPNSSRYNSIFITNNIFVSRALSNNFDLDFGFSNVFGIDRESPRTVYESYLNDEYVWSRDTSPKPRFYSFAPAMGLSYTSGKMKYSVRYLRVLGPYTDYSRREDSNISQMNKIQFLFSYKLK